MNKFLPLCCPCSLKSPLMGQEGGYVCANDKCVHAQEANKFPISNDIPVLVSEETCDTVCSMDGNATYVERPMAKYAGIRKFLVEESQVTKENCAAFIQQVTAQNPHPKILVIGAGERGSGADALWDHSDIEIHGVDIYGSNTVDVICDGHYLPLESDYYDGVWIQAVLEHVVEPSVVVAEIHRVLKEGAYVYAETPFMQQVHEGAYDFTRYTVLGHRYLFKNFTLVDMGGVKGPETVFAWSTRYLFWAITRSQKIARIIGFGMSLLMRPFKYLTSEASLYDASSGVYFMGKKKAGYQISHKDLVKLYKGHF